MENEIDYGEVFGLGEELSEGAAEEREAAGSETGAEAPDVREQEPAEPAGDEAEEPQRRNEEENRRYAAQRSRPEQEAGASRRADTAIASADAAAPRVGTEPEARRDGNRAGKGPASAEYRQPRRQTPAGELPEVRAARRAMEYVQEAEIHRKVEDQVKQISRLDPGIRERRDLSRLPCYEQMCRMVEKGYELADAYKVLNFEALLRRNEAAVRQAALNSVSGKSHMAQRKSRGEGGAYVPPDVAEEYRLFLPDITDAEIQEHYNRYVKRNGK